MRALVFPGQGSQAVGMCRDLYERHAAVREVYAEAADVLGYNVAAVTFEGPADRLMQTHVTQPALLVASIAVLRVAEEKGLSYQAALGHSLGEYTALVAVGALRFADAVQLVRRRGEVMQAAAEEHPGGMAAVLGLNDRAVEELCVGIGQLWPANYNAPGQVVVSGAVSALDELTRRAADAGARKVVRLPVSGAFHSPYMATAAVALRPSLEDACWSPPTRPFFSVSTVAFEDGGRPASFAALLERQITAPVRFTQSVRALIASGCKEFLEVGPGAVLSGLIKRIDASVRVARVGDVPTLDALTTGEKG
jgi:[acyl-carrier-protein] S-malonyltransferase